MSFELKILAWTLVLAVVQILLPAMWRNKETGIAYNASPRDEPGPPMGIVTARLKRAQSNLFETLPLFAVIVLIAQLTGRTGGLTEWGTSIYLAARVVYVPLYAAGVPYLRSLVWVVSMIGLLLLLIAVLR